MRIALVCNKDDFPVLEIHCPIPSIQELLDSKLSDPRLVKMHDIYLFSLQLQLHMIPELFTNFVTDLTKFQDTLEFFLI